MAALSTSPKIQFKEPDFGKTNRRGSTASSSSTAIEDDHDQDWTTITAEKDTWATRERRRSSVWNKIDSYPTINPSTSPTERQGSILSLFQHGTDKNGKSVLHSGEAVEDWGGDDLKRTLSGKTVAVHVQERRGSVLSVWTKGKDEKGRDIIHQG